MNKFIPIYFAILILNISLLSQTWTQLSSTNTPQGRTLSSAVYDSRGNRMIMFGGKLTDQSLTNQIWSLNISNNVWTNLTPPSGTMPSARFTHNGVYDSLLNRVIIWSGQGNSENYNDVWAFNLSNNTWQNLWADGNIAGVPAKRYGTSAVFESTTRRLITFAGFNTGQRYDDTWYFHVDSLIWVERTNSIHPFRRCLQSATIDRSLRKMFMYGGFSDTELHDDIWSLDLNTFQWTDVTPTSKPSGRYFTAELFTSSRNVFLFGGHVTNGVTNGIWRFNPQTNIFDSVVVNGTLPSQRFGGAYVYVPQQEKMIYFGGGDDHTFLGDLWEFSGINVIGITPISNEITKSFLLEQNYPNPFNPTTKIQFAIPVGDAYMRPVRLVIYDVLGREVATLVNEELKTGKYEVEFDAANYPSGIYFYKLTAQDFSETKKMVLVK